jgi:hypothetical protein
MAHMEKRVFCRRCRYRFWIEVPPVEQWRVEEQCPSCDSWDCFTVASTVEHEPPPPDPKALEKEAQELGQLLWQPIKENRDHPAIAWMDRVGNGCFEDDHTPTFWSIPTFWVYRFMRGNEAAYIWQSETTWLVRGWYPMRGCRRPPEPSEVLSFLAALDRLLE